MANIPARTVIIGLDGMPYRLIKHLAESGVMPNTRALIAEGVFREMESSIPEVSSVAWSSVITGANPGYHGIFGFTDIPAGTYRLSFPNSSNLRMPPFWQHEGNGRSVIMNVPSTYPASSLDGVLIAGFVSLDLQRATYPPSLVSKLNELGYQIDVDSGKAHQSIELFLRNLDRTLKARIKAYRYLWDREDWQTFMLVFTGTDRLAHFLWDAYEDRSHRYHDAFLDHLHQIDTTIGEIVNRMENDDLLIMLSDHGFERLEYDININYYLHDEGFLKFRKSPPQSPVDIDFGTTAFALDPARIYVNVAEKYPRGSVPPGDIESTIDRLCKTLRALEVNGRKVAAHIYRKEEVYEGPYLEQAPDLVLIPGPGFNFRSSFRAERLVEKGIFTGKHTQQDAFILLNNAPEDAVPSRPSVTDVVGIIKRLRGIQSERQSEESGRCTMRSARAGIARQ